MEKTREILLLEKLRQASRSARGGRRGGHGPGCGPCMPPMGPHGPHGMGPHGPHHGGMFPRERILTALLEAEADGLRQKDLAEKLGINAPALTEQIDRLEEERYLTRCANPDDRRSTLVQLTEKGRARAYEVADERQERAAAFCAALTEEEKDTLLALLDKLLADKEVRA